MPGTDMHTGGNGLSRSAEFSSGVKRDSTGSTYSTKQVAPSALPATPYKPSGVLSSQSVGGSGIGQSPDTFAANRMLNYYRA